MFGIRMKRILGSRVFWGTVVLYAAIMVAGAWEDLLAARDNPSVSLPYLYVVTTTVGIAHVLIPIVTLIPFAFFYVEELEKKSIYYNLIRCSKRSYYLSNAFAAILSCVLVSAGALCLYLLAGVACGARFYPGAGLLSFYEGSCFEPWFYTEQLWRLLAVNILLFLTASAPWGLLCLAVSILSKNKYIVIAFPFILEQLFSYTVQLTPFNKLPVPLDPVELLHGSVYRKLPYGGVPYRLCYQTMLMASLLLFYYFMSKRRYRREGI